MSLMTKRVTIFLCVAFGLFSMGFAYYRFHRHGVNQPVSNSHNLPTFAVEEMLVGKGEVAQRGKRVTFHYIGYLSDGTVFDSSRVRGSPFVIELGFGQAIKGLDQGLVGMRVGGRRILKIPPELAYGERGASGIVPPNESLKYEIELLKVDSDRP